MSVNKEIPQDRAYDLLDTFNQYNYVMFPQQRRIYKFLADVVKGKSVFEAGCGNGVGTAILARSAHQIVGTDKAQRNVDFAKCLYPWIDFHAWDMTTRDLKTKANVVICIEAIEHVEKAKDAIRNLIAIATHEVWISTPNGTNKPRPPANPYHVCEYTTQEMLDMIPSTLRVEILECDYFKPCDVSTQCDPLLYRIML